MSKSSKWYVTFRFSHPICVCISLPSSVCHMADCRL
jgi:hypothetical protein